MAANTATESGSPAARVFAIPELMEAILMNMPIRQVLHAQRINKDCEATIKGSLKLQQALFFQPFPLEKLAPPKSMPYDAVRMFNNVVEETQEKPTRGVLRTSHKYMLIVSNPFTDYINYDLDKIKFGALWARHGGTMQKSWREKARDRPEASWRRMYMTQPATEFWSRAQKFGEMGKELVDVQDWLHEKRRQTARFLRVDYACDLHAVLRGHMEASEVTPDYKRRLVWEITKDDKMPKRMEEYFRRRYGDALVDEALYG